MFGDPSLDALVILCTVPTEEVAQSLSRRLVEARAAACVNRVGPLRSVYRWQGAIHDDEEHQLVIKTTRGALDRVRELVLAHHPYDVPELVVLEAHVAHEPYARWLVGEVRGEVERDAG